MDTFEGATSDPTKHASVSCTQPPTCTYPYAAPYLHQQLRLHTTGSLVLALLASLATQAVDLVDEDDGGTSSSSHVKQAAHLFVCEHGCVCVCVCVCVSVRVCV